MDNSDRSGRRSFLSSVGVAAGAVVTLAPEAALAQRLVALGSPVGPGAVAPLGLTAARRIGRWTIVAVHPLRFGAVPVVLEDADGERFQVDVLRRDATSGAPAGIGDTDALSVFLSNRGDGETATREEHGLGALALAKALGDVEVVVPSALLTFSERRTRHPDAAYDVALA